jgi:hypothetical protein
MNGMKQLNMKTTANPLRPDFRADWHSTVAHALLGLSAAFAVFCLVQQACELRDQAPQIAARLRGLNQGFQAVQKAVVTNRPAAQRPPA